MSLEDWYIEFERHLCRCCHSEGTFKSLYSVCSLDIDEPYSEVLAYTLDIQLDPVSQPLTSATYSICEVCIARLKDAHSFKRQVLTCEMHFRKMYSNNCIKVAKPDIEVKQELPDPDDAENGFMDDCVAFTHIDKVQPKRKAKSKKVTQKRVGVTKRQKVTKHKQATDEESEKSGRSTAEEKVDESKDMDDLPEPEMCQDSLESYALSGGDLSETSTLASDIEIDEEEITTYMNTKEVSGKSDLESTPNLTLDSDISIFFQKSQNTDALSKSNYTATKTDEIKDFYFYCNKHVKDNKVPSTFGVQSRAGADFPRKRIQR